MVTENQLIAPRTRSKTKSIAPTQKKIQGLNPMDQEKNKGEGLTLSNNQEMDAEMIGNANVFQSSFMIPPRTKQGENVASTIPP